MDATPLLAEVAAAMAALRLAGLRDRSSTVTLGGATVRVASLADVVKSKRAARRPLDLAVLELLEKSLAKATASKG